MKSSIVGIVNVTPDSFSDGGRFVDPRSAIVHGLRLADEGADWLDIGGESTRPGALAVAAEVEAERVIPVIRGLLAERPDLQISVDTSKAFVAELALQAGARMINDVTALGDPRMAAVCRAASAEVVLMHMRGDPRTMERDTTFADVVGEVRDHLAKRAEIAMASGIAAERLILDPGIGFGKGANDNLRLIRGVADLRALGFRVLIGASRKRFIGTLTGVSEPSERVHGSVGAAIAAVARGADFVRVHDVSATRAALTVFQAVDRA